jgi:DNA-directed RNA polymerase subunit beta
MAYSFAEKKRIRNSFSKRPSILETPDLLTTQKESYFKFLQTATEPDDRLNRGLQAAFNSVFPVVSYNGDVHLEFVKYRLCTPVFDVKECQQRGQIYSAPIRVTLRLVIYDKESKKSNRTIRDVREQEVYLGEIPLMTDTGSFVINGTERVIVSQLHRSPGVFFGDDGGKTHSSGKLLFSARVIPYRGSWLDFEFDPKDLVYVRIDRRRKLPATVLLRALGYSSQEILEIFFDTDTFKLTKNDIKMALVPDRLRGQDLFFDIKTPKGDVIVEAGQRITARLTRELTKARIKSLPVPDEYFLGRTMAEDFIDPDTGEILFEANSILTEEMLEVFRKLHL